jgi:hypothetical protein
MMETILNILSKRPGREAGQESEDEMSTESAEPVLDVPFLVTARELRNRRCQRLDQPSRSEAESVAGRVSDLKRVSDEQGKTVS